MSTFASSQPRFTQFVFPDSKMGHQTSNSSNSFSITTNKLNRPRTSHSQVAPAPRASKLNQPSSQSLSQSTSHPINQSANFANKQTTTSRPMDEREQALRRSAATMERPITSSSRPPPPTVFKTCHYTELQEAYQWDLYRKSMDPHHSVEEPSRTEHARHYDVYDSYTMNQTVKDNTAYIEEMKNKREEVEIFLKKMRARRGDTQVPITRREHRELKEREIAMNQRSQSSEDAASMSRPASPYTSTSWAASPVVSPARTRATSPTAQVNVHAVNQPAIPVHQPVHQLDPSISSALPASVVNQSAAHAASVDPSVLSSGKSNIARFWQEEIDRKRHQASDARESRRRRHMGQLAIPDDPQEARALWERMKDEMWRHWEATQQPSQDPSRPVNQSTSQSMNEAATEPHVQSAEKLSPSASAKPSSPTKASFESIKPAPAPLPRRASSPMKRATSAAVGPNQHRPATPLKARSGSYHPPVTPQPARSSSASKPTFSTNNLRPRTPAVPVVTPLSMSPPLAATPAPPISPYSSYTIKQLMDSMDKFGLSAVDCVEKIDMIEKLERYQQQQYRQSQQVRFERDCEQAVIDINSWVKQKPIQTLLNELNASFISVGTMPALTFSSSLQDVERVYRRTLLTIHPDKVPHDDFLHKFKATEVFKIIHSRFKEFKLQVEGLHGHALHDLSNQAHYFRQ